MLKIGLTGGIGSGKSTAAKMFARLGITIIDLDQISRELVEPGTPALEKITERFGSVILQNSGELNRGKLGEIVFSNEGDKEWLEKLLHPKIRAHQQALIDSASGPYVLIEIPLLVENQLQKTVDRVLVVDVEEQIQVSRAAKRDNREKTEIVAVLNAQASREDRLQIADDIINNDGNTDELQNQVNQLHEKYLQLAHSN